MTQTLTLGGGTVSDFEFWSFEFVSDFNTNEHLALIRSRCSVKYSFCVIILK